MLPRRRQRTATVPNVEGDIEPTRKCRHSRLHLTIRFARDDAVRSELIDLVAAERICCGFVGWTLKDLGNEMVLTISGDTEGVAAMAESFGREWIAGRD